MSFSKNFAANVHYRYLFAEPQFSPPNSVQNGGPVMNPDRGSVVGVSYSSNPLYLCRMEDQWWTLTGGLWWGWATVLTPLTLCRMEDQWWTLTGGLWWGWATGSRSRSSTWWRCSTWAQGSLSTCPKPICRSSYRYQKNSRLGFVERAPSWGGSHKDNF